MSAALEAAAFFWECAALFARRLFAGGLQSLRGDLQEAGIILGSAVFRCCCRLSIFGRLPAFESLERFGVPSAFCALAPFGFWAFWLFAKEVRMRLLKGDMRHAARVGIFGKPALHMCGVFWGERCRQLANMRPFKGGFRSDGAFMKMSAFCKALSAFEGPAAFGARRVVFAHLARGA